MGYKGERRLVDTTLRRDGKQACADKQKYNARKWVVERQTGRKGADGTKGATRWPRGIVAAGRKQYIQLTVIVLSPDLGVFCALQFFSLALLRSSSGSFWSLSFFLCFLGSFQWMLYKNIIFALGNEHIVEPLLHMFTC